ncbi:putative ABC transporter ATP-binding protein, partial [Streptococcus ratti FA-1 = DSM 20564]
MAYIEMKNSYKRYQTGGTEIIANNNVSFEIEKGELVIVLGASGAGKSTVLNILGGMDTNDEGQVIIDGEDIAGYNAKQRTSYRRTDVGFVFQFYNLVPNLTAKENVELASEIVSDARDAAATLESVGLGQRLNNFPAQLS